MAENGYTTVFHERNKGVTIHKSGTLAITTSEPLVLREAANQLDQNYGQFSLMETNQNMKK
jgi:hypothetical protein